VLRLRRRCLYASFPSHDRHDGVGPSIVAQSMPCDAPFAIPSATPSAGVDGLAQVERVAMNCWTLVDAPLDNGHLFPSTA
jgi:hypothetical protein